MEIRVPQAMVEALVMLASTDAWIKGLSGELRQKLRGKLTSAASEAIKTAATDGLIRLPSAEDAESLKQVCSIIVDHCAAPDRLKGACQAVLKGMPTS